MAVGTTAIAGLLATFSRYQQWFPQLCLTAAVIALFGCLPPLWFSRWFQQGAAAQLAVVAWRFASLMPALVVLRRLEGPERNCFMYTMLACYFVALSLESWLLIRDAQRQQQ